MILNDLALDKRAKAGMVTPYNPAHLSGCSIDLTLSDHILVESLDDSSNGWVECDITDGYSMIPKQFVLASTAEVITIPHDCCGKIFLRSSAARAGLDHCLAGFLDSGFSGQVTLELSNKLQLHNFELCKGQRLIQLVIYQLNSTPSNTYDRTGNYHNQRRATPSNLNFAPLSQ